MFLVLTVVFVSLFMAIILEGYTLSTRLGVNEVFIIRTQVFVLLLSIAIIIITLRTLPDKRKEQVSDLLQVTLMKQSLELAATVAGVAVETNTRLDLAAGPGLPGTDGGENGDDDLGILGALMHVSRVNQGR